MHDVVRRIGRAAIGAAVRYGGLGTLLTRASRPRGAPRILYYHRVVEQVGPLDVGLAVSAANFAAQVRFLAAEFQVKPLEAMLDRWVRGEPVGDRELALTFDDGYRDNYDLAFPVLRRYGVPGTIFLTTGHIGSATLLWWDRVAALLGGARRTGLRDLPTSVDLPPQAAAHARAFLRDGDGRGVAGVVNALKPLRPDGRTRAVAELDAALRGGAGVAQGDRTFLSWDEARDMQRHGIAFGAHTVTHAVLTELPDADVERELCESAETMARELGERPRVFAYPDGCVDARVRDLVARAGYAFAVQTQRHAGGYDGDPLTIPRTKIKEGHSIGVTGGFSGSAFTAEATGVADLLLVRRLRARNPYLG